MTGYPPLPPIYSFGFHFSKWSNVNISVILSRNYNFEKTLIPVDVLWMDIPHTDKGKYFTFNPDAFPSAAHQDMNSVIE